MSKQVNPTSLGLFILFGLTLGVGGLLLFTSSKLFTPTEQFILYFDDSLNGLSEGAPVKYRGVTVGTVRRTMIHFNQGTNDLAMPVIIELQENLVRERLGEQPDLLDGTAIDAQVQRGLRATLQAESLVTGVLYVELETILNPPLPDYHQLEKLYTEIPTHRTGIQQLLKNLAQLDFKGLEEKLSTLLTRIDSTVGNVKTDEISTGLTNLLGTLNRIAASAELTNALTSVGQTLAQYRELAERLGNRVDPLADSMTNTLAQASETIAQLREAAQNLRSLLAPDSALGHELSVALDQLANAGQSMSALTEFLQRHPNALITGREHPARKP
jgi:paraquat-inducible protein B